MTKHSGATLPEVSGGLEIEQMIKDMVRLECDPLTIAKKLSQIALPQLRKGEQLDTQASDLITQGMMSASLDSHYALAEVVDSKYRSLAISFSRQLVKEYNCTKSSEKALVHLIVNAYTRVLSFSNQIAATKDVELLSPQKNGFYVMLGKELDRANRQFISALMMLQQMKTPTMNFQLKVGTAFVAQNQQINADLKSNPDHHEIIDAK